MENMATQIKPCDHFYRFLRVSAEPAHREIGETRRKQIYKCRKCGHVKQV